MKHKYPLLQGKCKTCLFKCGRVEDINFKGVWRCEYHTIEQMEIKEATNDRNRISHRNEKLF